MIWGGKTDVHYWAFKDFFAIDMALNFNISNVFGVMECKMNVFN